MLYLLCFLRVKIGFTHSTCDNSLFIYKHDRHTTYFLLYVDDIILTVLSTSFRQSIIKVLSFEISMKDLAPLIYILVVYSYLSPNMLYEILAWAGMS